MISLTLPSSSSPALDEISKRGQGLLPFALYLHVKLDDAEVKELLQVCNSAHDIDEETVRLAPKHNMSDQPLVSAYNEHLKNVAQAGVYDPVRFVAVVDQPWKQSGVLLVALDTKEDLHKCVVDQMRVSAKNSALYLVNLQISNVDWEDYKDIEGQDDSDDDVEEPSGETPEAEEVWLDYDAMTDEDYDDGTHGFDPTMGYWIGIYARPGLDWQELLESFDTPSYENGKMTARPEGRVIGDLAVALQQALRLHPMRCSKNPVLCRDMFFLADTTSFEERGLLHVQFKWDRKVDGKTLTQLASAGSSAAYDSKRVPITPNDTVTLFNMVVDGDIPFRPTHKTFWFYDESGDTESKSLHFLDHRAERRLDTMHRFFDGSLMNRIDDRDEKDAQLSVWQQVVRRHATQVYRERFCVTLQRQYFVYTRLQLSSSQEHVVLAKTAWSGDVEGMTEEEIDGTSLPEGLLDVTVMSCEASHAYDTLGDIIDGRKQWQPEALDLE